MCLAVELKKCKMSSNDRVTTERSEARMRVAHYSRTAE